jgi:hypothetical protein
MLRASKGKLDTKAIADVIETELNEATSEREEGERRRLAERLTSCSATSICKSATKRMRSASSRISCRASGVSEAPGFRLARDWRLSLSYFAFKGVANEKYRCPK